MFPIHLLIYIELLYLLNLNQVLNFLEQNTNDFMASRIKTMKFITKYLNQIQEDYKNPIQTRPKPTGGITGKPKERNPLEDELGSKGPAGPEVDLDDDQELPGQKPFTYKFKTK